MRWDRWPATSLGSERMGSGFRYVNARSEHDLLGPTHQDGCLLHVMFYGHIGTTAVFYPCWSPREQKTSNFAKLKRCLATCERD
jgi:hypothetical protein